MTKSASDSHPHVHEPNLTPPHADPAFVLLAPTGRARRFKPEDLMAMPQHSVRNCYIVSTGHGASGPFTFSGVTLRDFLDAALDSDAEWAIAELLGADGFGTGVQRDEIADSSRQPILLATHMDGKLMTREQGLVRLIVPSETTDALRQVKWLSAIVVRL